MRPALALAALVPLTLLAQTRSVTDPGVITTRQAITPAGVQTVLDGRVYGVAFGASENEVWVLHTGALTQLDWRANKRISRIEQPGSPGLQGIRFAGGIPWTSVVPRGTGSSPQLRAGQQTFGLGGSQLAGGLATNGKIAAVPLIYNNELVIVNPAASGPPKRIKTEIAPFGAAINSAGTVAWVTNWGGRVPRPGDLTAPTGRAANADQVVIDARGIASTGTVSRIDLETGAATNVAVGRHPTGIVWHEASNRLYIANNNDDSISVIDTRRNAVAAAWELKPFAEKVAGIAPTAVETSRDGRTLYVACGGINAVLVMDTATGAIRGAIPTAWYPNSVSAGEKHLAIGTLLGVGSGFQNDPKRRYVHSYRGTVHIVPLPDEAQLAGYTAVMAENNRAHLLKTERARPGAKPAPIPARSGEPSLIEHVVYIVKENRTYDQVLGDLGKGNGEPSFVMFGEDVAPNHRRLADQFVLYDNFYASGGNSADGHQWVTQSTQTAYTLWPGYAGRSYPYDGSDPIAPAAGGFLWDAAVKMKKSVRIFGEYAGETREPRERHLELLAEWRKGADFTARWNHTAPMASVNPLLAKNFPGYTNSIPDVVRAQIFRAALAGWEKSGSMPNLVLVQLPNDHTFGTSPGVPTPKAMVATNDLALGQVVEALTRSRFWPKMAIFVVEDDAQNGVDHVDGHRTVALAISPYVRRGAVDSTFYSNTSMVKTIELILGLPALSMFDLIANDMRESFTSAANLEPYAAVTPRQALDEVNPRLQALNGAARRAAADSLRMKFDQPDQAPTDRLNRILWGAIKGWNAPYPKVRVGVFAPLAVDVDDDDR